MPVWWDRMVMLLTVAALVLIVVDVQFDEDSRESHIVGWIDLGLCVFFLVDFGFRFHRARRFRKRFLKRNWIDLLGAVPLVGPLRAARLIRFVRLVRVGRLVALSRRVLRNVDMPVSTETLFNLIVVTVSVWAAAGAAFFEFESGVNDNVKDIGDALWWSMTTLSTVGYGDLYPVTGGGRIVAVMTMVVGIGVLGTLAATVAAGLIEFRERGRSGQRSHRMKEHLLVLGWNDKSFAAIDDFRHDPRYLEMKICVVADLESAPIAEPVRFVRGLPSHRESLEKASASKAAAAIVFAGDHADPHSDHLTALTVLLLRRINAECRISAELVSPMNREHLEAAGCDAVVDTREVAATLLVRSVQDMGVGDLVRDLLTNRYGSEIYRAEVDPAFVGKTWTDYTLALLRDRVTLMGLARDKGFMLNPDPDLVLAQGDEIFVISEEPPD